MKTINLYRQELIIVSEQTVEEAVSNSKIATILINNGVTGVLSVRKANGRRLHRLYQLANGEYQEA